jgi:soluble lytic murein transglycosylase-like protein
MQEEPGPSAVKTGMFGIRCGERDRRADVDRRSRDRGTPDRRSRQRRRSTLRSLFFTILTLAIPHPIKQGVPKAARLTVASPSPSPVVEIPQVPSRSKYAHFIREAARKHRVDEALIRSVIEVESGFDPKAVSPAGALGLMQLMPALAEELGVDEPLDPQENIMAGAQYLRRLLDRHDGNITLALASYNAGPAAVARYGRIPPYGETRRYVKKVTALIATHRSETD